MRNPRARLAAALCGSAAALVMASGWSPAVTPDADAANAAGAPVGVAPAPPSPTVPGGALPVHPAGGGGCVIGLNCGCIPNITCPKPPRHRPGNANGEQHPAPPQQDP